MANQVDPNKVTDKTERRSEHLKDKYEHQGMGQDEARKRAVAEAAGESTSGGGAHSGGDPKQGHNHEGGNRRGSDKEAG